MTLTDIRRHLQEIGVRPSRRLGQNFLHDQNLARLIVDLTGVKAGDTVLEIGPGLGALTEYLLERNPLLTLLEKDSRLAAFLRQRHPQTRLVEGDAMESLDGFESQLDDAIVLGNLPYSVASPIIVRLCEASLLPRRMIFTIQLEVAERLVAQPRTKDYGLLTLLTRPFYDIQLSRRIPHSVFWPQPEVDSAVITMERRAKQPFKSAIPDLAFREKVKKAFQQRRKTLGAIFGTPLPHGMDRARRPEELTVEEWIGMASPGQSGEEWFDIVNDQDAVVGKERRSEVHRQGLWHRAIHIFIWNQKGELLLQKRSPHKDVAPGTWDSSAAGHLGLGEPYDEAADREIVEELGISIPLTRLHKFDCCHELGWEFVCLYEGRSEGPFQFPPDEISELKWWTPQAIDQAVLESPRDFAPSFCHIWKFHQEKT